MGKSEAQEALNDWQKRSSQYEAAGIPSSVYLPIAKADIGKVLQSDAEPMTTLEANTAVMSAATGKPVITEAPRHSKGILGDIGTIASNIEPDLSNLITSAPRGIVDTAKTALNPTTYKTIADVISGSNTDPDVQAVMKKAGVNPATYNPDSLSDLGATFRIVANTPLLNLIPGISDIAQATTGSGRQSLLEHPLSAALDIAPVEGLAEGAGSLLGGIDKEAVRAGADAGVRPVDALAQGSVGKAAARLIDQRGLAKIPGLGGIGDIRDVEGEEGRALGPGQRLAARAAQSFHLDDANKALSTILPQASRKAMAEAHITNQQIKEIFEGMTKEDLDQFSRKAASLDLTPLTDREQQAMDDVKVLAQKIEDTGIKNGDLTRLKEGVYPTDSPIARASRRIDTATKIVQRRADRVDQAQDRVNAITQDIATPSRRLIAAQARLAKIEDIVRSHGEDPTPREVQELDRADDAVEKAKLPTASQKLELARANKQLERAKNQHAASTARLLKNQDTYRKELFKNPPANLHPMIRQAMRDRVIGKVKDVYNSTAREAGLSGMDDVSLHGTQILDRYNQLLKSINNAQGYGEILKDAIGDDEYQALWSDVVTEALKLNTEGIPPVFITNLHPEDLDRVLSVNIAKEQDIKESQVMTKMFNYNDSIINVQAGQLRAALNTIQRDGMQDVYEKGLKPHERTYFSLIGAYQRRAEAELRAGKIRGVSEGARADQLLRKEWKKFDFDKYGIKHTAGVGKLEDTYIPASLADNLESWAKPGGSALFSNKGYQLSMKVFRTSVLYGPRHFVHVAVGGLMPLALDQPEALLDIRNFMDYHRARKAGNLPAFITDHSTAGRLDFSDNAWNLKVGSKYAQFWKEHQIANNVLHLPQAAGAGMERIENMAQDMYKGISYFNALRKGDSPTMAINMARKIVQDLDGATPFERTIMKQVMPFYSFTRFAVKFLAQYPFDHPTRVAILSGISNQAQEEWGTGLPQKMMSLFFLGKPDKNGNIKTIDTKNLNPFRSVASIFTLQGFFSSLNPAIQFLPSTMGLDTLSGTPDLYPELHYDATTGDLSATRPKGDLLTAVESYVPESEAITFFTDSTDSLKTLRATDPGAFQREIANMFNIPFAPSTYNIPQTREKASENALLGAQNALTDFKKSDNPNGDIARYNLVPYQGNLYTPAQIEAYWNSLLKQDDPSGGDAVDPAALIPSTYSSGSSRPPSV